MAPLRIFQNILHVRRLSCMHLIQISFGMWNLTIKSAIRIIPCAKTIRKESIPDTVTQGSNADWSRFVTS